MATNHFGVLLRTPAAEGREDVTIAASAVSSAVESGLAAIGQLLCSVGANPQDNYELDSATLFDLGWLIVTLAHLQGELRGSISAAQLAKCRQAEAHP